MDNYIYNHLYIYFKEKGDILNKKGQVTLFIILAIIIIAVVVLGFALKDSFIKSGSEEETALLASLSPDLAEVREEVYTCSQLILEEAILETGNYAGYNSALENSLEVEDVSVNYGYFEGRNMLPSLSTTESEISEYIETFLPDCANLESFDLEITAQDPEANIEILNDKVSAEISYPITIIKEGASSRINEPYYAEKEINFKSIYNTASEIVENMADNPVEIDISYLLDLGWDISVVPVDEKTAVFSIEDTTSSLESPEGKSSFAYVFATKAR